MNYILAIDQGTTSSKVLVMDTDLNAVAEKSIPFEQFFPQPGWVEHDADQIWKSVEDSIQEVCNKYMLTFNAYNNNHLAKRFRLSSNKFFHDYVKPYGEDYMDYFGLDVLEFFTECADYGDHTVNNVVTWPDHGHLGFTGHVLLFEYVLKFIEELQVK